MYDTHPLIDLIYAMSLCGFYTLVCLLFGVGLLRLVKICPSKGMNLSGEGYLGGAFFVGQGIFGALWQTIATLGYFSLSVVVAILVITGLSGVSQLPSIIRLTFKSFKSVVKDTWSLGLIWAALAILVILLVGIFACLTLHPPNCDALAYYLAQEKLMALTHHLTPLPGYELLCHFGLNAEMHGSVMYLMGGDVIGEYAANMMVWVTAIACGAVLWAISSEVGLTRLGQWSVMAMLFTSTAFTLVMWAGKTDLFGTGLGLAAIYCVLQIGKVSNWIALLLAGLMVGFAINSKMSFVVVTIPMLGVLAAIFLYKNFTPEEGDKRSPWISKGVYLLKAAFIAGGAVLLTFLPLFFKNALIFNEPLAPFIYLHMAGNAALDQVWYTPENIRWIVLTYPLALTFGQYPMQFGNLSPLWLAFLPALFFFPKCLGVFQNKPLTYLTLSSLVGVAFWVLLQPSTLAPRYILPPLLTLFPIGGFIVEQVWRQRGYFMLRFFMYISMGIMLLYTFETIKTSLAVAKNYLMASPLNYQDETWKTFSLINNQAKKGDRVFLATYSRLPLRSDLLQTLFTMEENDELGMSRILTAKTTPTSSANAWERIYSYGGRWVIVDHITHAKQPGFEILSNLKVAPDFLSIISYRISDRYMVYQIVPKEGAPKPMKTSLEQEEGTWKVQDLTN